MNTKDATSQTPERSRTPERDKTPARPPRAQRTPRSRWSPQHARQPQSQPTLARHLPDQPPERHEVPDEVLLGRYRVLARRGTGGFGTVCTCWDTRLQRRVAIKRIPVLQTADASGVAPSTVDEALAEARTACLLAHPNIVTVFDFETDGTWAYIVMEYVDGLNLAELLARVEGGVLTHEECAHVLRSVADALGYAHENGVLHLDIKPTNIMVDRQGVVKLADFGMATLASAAGYGGARGGTVGYMPPEQIQGLLVDERTDVFSLAVVTWQALTGRNPFEASSAKASLDKISHGPSPALSALDVTLAGEPEDTLTEAMDPESQGRPSSATGLAKRILPFLGSADEGRESLRRLVDQAEDDEPTESWDVRHLPPYVSHPKLEPALERVFAALVTLWAAHLVLPALVEPGTTRLAWALALTGATALWPPLGSALAATLLVAAVGTAAQTTASFPLAFATALALGVWWLAVGRTEHMATPALLLPACLGTPVAGAALAAFSLDPLPAAATGAMSALMGTYLPLALESGFQATQLASALVAVLSQPASWALVAACAVSAGISSAIAMRGSVTSGVVGQVVGLVALLAGLVLAARVENGGIWSAPAWGACALAVLLGVLATIFTVLRGPLDNNGEGDENS